AHFGSHVGERHTLGCQNVPIAHHRVDGGVLAENIPRHNWFFYLSGMALGPSAQVRLHPDTLKFGSNRELLGWRNDTHLPKDCFAERCRAVRFVWKKIDQAVQIELSLGA